MGQGRPTGASYGAAHATIDLDLAALTAAPRVAQAAGEATAKALQQSLKIVQNEQKIAIANAQAATAAMRAQQAQITSTTRAESQERIQQAKAESVAQQQAARASATATIEQERRKTAQVKQEIKERNKSQVSGSSFGQSAASFVGAAVGGPIGGLVGAATMGNPALAAGLAVGQGARFVIDAAQLATAYNRQNVAARSLAGSQAKLNELLVAYEKASGGAIDKATEMAKVTSLEATGFAKSAADLEEFVSGVRGASIALGKSQDYIAQETQLAIVNQSKRRLDQIGLGVDEVTKRIGALRQANKALTSEQAFSMAVIGLLNEKFGDLNKSVEGQKTGLERLGAAWTDFQLQVGQDGGGAVNQIAGFIADRFKFQTDADAAQAQATKTRVFTAPKDATDAQKQGIQLAKYIDDGQRRNALAARTLQDAWLSIAVFMGRISQAQKDLIMNQSKLTNSVQAAPFVTAISGVVQGSSGPTRRFTDDQESALVEWNTKRVAIERETQAAVVAEAHAWGVQRLEAERAYTKQSVREAEDWARSQARTQEDFQESLANVAKDSAKQQARAERDLNRSIASEQADSAEKVADIRKDSAKRLAEIEESYADDREKAAQDHSDKLLDAAGNLDAKAVYEEQRNYAKQAQEAKKAHDKQVADAKEQLDERVGDEAKSLEKSIRQQKEALALREADQAADDAQRIEDMKAQFTKEQERADEDRGIRLGRMAQDQQDQLDAIDRAHYDRMDEIAQRAADENKAIETILTDAHIAIKGFVDTSVDDAITAFDKFYGHMEDKFNGKKDAAQAGIPATSSSPAGFASGGWVGRGGFARVHAGEFMLSNGMLAGNQPIPASVRGAISNNNSRAINIHPGAVVIHAAPGMDEDRLVRKAIDGLIEVLEAA